MGIFGCQEVTKELGTLQTKDHRIHPQTLKSKFEKNDNQERNFLATPPSDDEEPVKYKEQFPKEKIKENEIFVEGNVSLPIKIINKATKSVCKIIINDKPKPSFGTGFFMKISESQEYLFKIIMFYLKKQKIKISI